MKLMQVVDIPQRENEIMGRIRAQILTCDSHAQVEMIEYRDPAFFEKILAAKPDVILTFAFSAYPVSQTFYPLKYILGCHIVCMRTEGVLYFDPDNIKILVGPDRYSNRIVDYEIFWGEEAARFMVEELLRQNKISGRDRAKSFGYVLYEDYFKPRAKPALCAEHIARIERHPKEKVLFFVTGFTQADYSAADIIRSGDQVDVNNRTTFAKEMNYRMFRADRSAYYRTLWIQKIVEVAQRHRDVLIIVKSHPTENFVNQRRAQNPYRAFQGIDNIIHLTRDVPIIDLMQRCGLFLHYGSTTAAESYLSRKPSVLIESEDYVILPKGCKSTRKINILQLPDLVAEHLRRPIVYEEFAEAGLLLKQAFNIGAEHLSGQTPYQPSRDMAEFLIGLQHEKPQATDRNDPFLQAAMAVHGNQVLAALKKIQATSRINEAQALRCTG